MKLEDQNILDFTFHNLMLEGIYVPLTDVMKRIYTEPFFIPDNDMPGLHYANIPYVRAHFEAIEYVVKRKDRKPTIGDIMNLQKFFTDVCGAKNKMRTSPMILHDRVAPYPSEIADLFLDWMSTWDKMLYKTYSKKKLCLIRHYEFMHIAPFVECLGIVGRLVNLWDCLYNNTQMDIIRDKQEYLEGLREYVEDNRDRLIKKWN